MVIKLDQGCLTVRDNKVNLCDLCRFTFPDCGVTDVLFGDGIGNDNICCCGTYEPGERMLNKAEILAIINGYIEQYAPVCLDIAGRWVGGDEKVYLALKDLLYDVQRMPDLADDGR